VTTTSVVVVDASLALKWVLIETHSGEALLLLTEWAQSGLQPVVPSWFACEVANVLYQRVRGGQVTSAEAQTALDAVLALVVVYGDEPADARRAIEIAEEAGEKATYDSQYAALAERLRCELWTADDRYRDAVRGVVSGVHSLSEISS
jgi:predicted nucleic acid-binding protein